MQKTFLYLMSFVFITLAVLMQVDLITALLNLMLSTNQSRGLIILWLITYFETEINAWYLIDHAYLFLTISFILLSFGVILLVLATRITKYCIVIHFNEFKHC